MINITMPPGQSKATPGREAICFCCEANGWDRTRIDNEVLPAAVRVVEQILDHDHMKRGGMTRDGAFAIFFYASDTLRALSTRMQELLSDGDTTGLQPFAVILCHLQDALRRLDHVNDKAYCYLPQNHPCTRKSEGTTMRLNRWLKLGPTMDSLEFEERPPGTVMIINGVFTSYFDGMNGVVLLLPNSYVKLGTPTPHALDELTVVEAARVSKELYQFHITPEAPVTDTTPNVTSWRRKPVFWTITIALVLAILGPFIWSPGSPSERYPQNNTEYNLPECAARDVGAAPTEIPEQEQQPTVIADDSNGVADGDSVPEAVEAVPPTPRLRFERADVLPHHGESNGCRLIERTFAVVKRPAEANVSLRSLQIGNDVFNPKGCITPAGYFSSVKVESRCTNLIVFQRVRFLVTQDIGSDGRDEWTIEGLVDCGKESPKFDHKDESMKNRNAGHQRRLQFNVSGDRDFTTEHAVHVVSHHGGMTVFDDRLPLRVHPKNNVESKFTVNPEINKLLLRTGGIYELDPECNPEVRTALSHLSNGTSAELIVYASVPELCDAPPLRLLSSPTDSYFVLHRKALTKKDMGQYGIVDSSKPFAAESIRLSFPAGQDLPARLQLPIRIQDVVLATTVDTYPLWSRAADLCVNVVGPVGVGKSSMCGWLFCFFLTDLERGTINECLLHTNPFERGQNSQFTHTKERLSRESESGVRISDNPGTVKLAADAIDDKTPDAQSLENELNGHCSGDCSPGDCRRKEAKCNPGDLRCPDVDLILVPLAGVDSKQPVGGENHPLYYEHQRMALLQEGKHQCKQPAVIVVQVKQAVAGNSASITITDPAISIHSALYREAERELCDKARNVLHANDGTLCVAMSAFVPQQEVDSEWINRFVDAVRSLEKKLLGAKKKKTAEKNRKDSKN